ncbi:zf-HC2 domain-containing protein [Derxia gummosa]|uniref:Zf-HC2 domain-containing protein n=1 Tax=Derxia gummosa DSM 723 TaxID=1121388 RepID=A0A8B6X3X0_9BURK|nr:zf-HC2 domain-containing protein [Derxia gummosa]
MKCRDAAALSSRALDTRLGPVERARLLLHLGHCRRCARYREQIGLLRLLAARRGEGRARE